MTVSARSNNYFIVVVLIHFADARNPFRVSANNYSLCRFDEMACIMSVEFGSSACIEQDNMPSNSSSYTLYIEYNEYLCVFDKFGPCVCDA